MQREFHPVANLFPLLQGRDFAELVCDIKDHGLREPILVDAQGVIVDGRNRYRACQAAGVEPRFAEWTGDSTHVGLVLSLNVRRRHLTPSQRALVAARLAKQFHEATRLRRGSGKLAPVPTAFRRISREHAGQLLNVSSRLVGHAIKLLRDGCEELITAVECKEVLLTPAAYLARLPHQEQADLLTDDPKPLARKVRELRRSKSDTLVDLPFGLGCRPDDDTVRHFWVAREGLCQAVNALKARGFRYQPIPP